jgi:hypothetical protein
LLAWLLYQKSADMPLKFVYWVSLVLKLTASVAVGLIYAHYYHYQSDSFLYFNDGVQLSNLAVQQPTAYFKILLFNEFKSQDISSHLGLWTQPRAFFMAKLVSLINIFTLNNYWVSGWYLTLFSFYAHWQLANTLSTIFPASKLASVMAFLLFPSVVFWSAGLTKETVAMACIIGSLHMLLSYTFNLYHSVSLGKKLAHSLFISIACFVLWKLKYYYLGALLPVCLAYLATVYLFKHYFTATKPGLQISFLVILFCCILLLATQLHPNLWFSRFLQTLVINHNGTLQASSPEDLIHFNYLQPSWQSILQNLPLALFSGLFRPLAWEARTLFQWITGIENLFILVLTLYALTQIKPAGKLQEPKVYLLLTAALIYILFLSALLALSSPNFGALSRYKIAFLPLLLYIILFPISKFFQQRFMPPATDILHKQAGDKKR